MGSLPTSFVLSPHPLMPATGQNPIPISNPLHDQTELVPHSAPPAYSNQQIFFASSVNMSHPSGTQEEPIISLPLVPASGSHPMHHLSTPTSVAATAAAAVASGMFGPRFR